MDPCTDRQGQSEEELKARRCAGGLLCTVRRRDGTGGLRLLQPAQPLEKVTNTGLGKLSRRHLSAAGVFNREIHDSSAGEALLYITDGV